ncbi:MAG: glycerol-3-phosphate 1-O-acyltransferase PlsY [Eubacteriaceae bacterium]|nr:glycerol-3-phosphate 1-O-acyltransferase PlsY [Eubacteriaceae bacterium]
MTPLQMITVAITGYLLGCIHPSYLFARRIKNIDIREHGSNNTGASNATIVLGWKYGIITGAIDIFKGLLAVVLASHVIASGSHAAYLGGFFAIIGHMYPFYLGFRGGKGLATVIGFFGGVNFFLTLGVSALFIAVSLITDYIVMGTVTFVICFAYYTVNTYGLMSFESAVALVVAFMILIKHRKNYKRIWNKTETTLSSMYKKKDA